MGWVESSEGESDEQRVLNKRTTLMRFAFCVAIFRCFSPMHSRGALAPASMLLYQKSRRIG